MSDDPLDDRLTHQRFDIVATLTLTLCRGDATDAAALATAVAAALAWQADLAREDWLASAGAAFDLYSKRGIRFTRVLLDDNEDDLS